MSWTPDDESSRRIAISLPIASSTGVLCIELCIELEQRDSVGHEASNRLRRGELFCYIPARPGSTAATSGAGSRSLCTI